MKKNKYYLTGIWYDENQTPFTFFYRTIINNVNTVSADANIQHANYGSLVIETDAPLPFQLKTPIYLADGKKRLITSITTPTYITNTPASRIAYPNSTIRVLEVNQYGTNTLDSLYSAMYK